MTDCLAGSGTIDNFNGHTISGVLMDNLTWTWPMIEKGGYSGPNTVSAPFPIANGNLSFSFGNAYCQDETAVQYTGGLINTTTQCDTGYEANGLICEIATCTPFTCADFPTEAGGPAECGSYDQGCGLPALNCGTCGAFETCEADKTCLRRYHFFLSSSQYNGNLGGQSGANTKCNADPKAKTDRTYRAVIRECDQNDANTPCTKFGKTGTYWESEHVEGYIEDDVYSAAAAAGGGHPYVYVAKKDRCNCENFSSTIDDTVFVTRAYYYIGKLNYAFAGNCSTSSSSILCAESVGLDLGDDNLNLDSYSNCPEPTPPPTTDSCSCCASTDPQCVMYEAEASFYTTETECLSAYQASNGSPCFIWN